MKDKIVEQRSIQKTLENRVSFLKNFSKSKHTTFKGVFSWGICTLFWSWKVNWDMVKTKDGNEILVLLFHIASHHFALDYVFY